MRVPHRTPHLEIVILDGPRRPTTVQGWMQWYIEQRSRKLLRAQNIGGVGTPIHRARQEEDRVLFAMLTLCLVEWDAANDLEPYPLGRGDWLYRSLDALVTWWRSSATKGQQRMSDEQGIDPAEMSERFGRVEGVLRRRMAPRGFLEDAWSVP